MERGLASLLLVVCAVGCSCGVEAKGHAGTQCELNTDCAAPLVCRLGQCRNECNTARDCPIGLACIRDEGGFGICQLPDDRACDLASDCPEPLVCRLRQCVNECGDDRDCPPGATCTEGGCIDESVEMACVRDSDCDFPLRCAVDGRCRRECSSDLDCRLETRCGSDSLCRRQCASDADCAGVVCDLAEGLCVAGPPGADGGGV